MSTTIRHLATLLTSAALAFVPTGAGAQTIIPAPAAQSAPSYADVVDLADSAPLVLRVQIVRITRIEDARAGSVTPGSGRFFVEAKTQALLTGNTVLGESVRYLADLPLDAKGKPPKLKKQVALLFARPVVGRPGELQLVTPTAQLAWNPASEQQVRGVIKEILAPDAPTRVSGVRELLYVPGALAGQGETQIFLNTKDGSAASITVRRQPGSAPQWGASFSELVADLGHPPQRDTLEWYRLACFLPKSPPATANVSETDADRRQAAADYRMVISQLGTCDRSMRQPAR